jgi:nucleoside-diphosphate-sugar epimerase
LQQGFKVTSLSRSGRLTRNNIPVDSLSKLSQIQWREFDIFDQTSENRAKLAELLGDADAVVHSLGAVTDAVPDYKKVVNSRIDGLGPVLGQLFWEKLRSPDGNPLDRKPASASNGEESALEKLNFESAKILADEFAAAVKGKNNSTNDTVAATPASRPFVYISADEQHAISDEYIRTKRLAEHYIGTHPELRGVYLRPGFMVDSKTGAGASLCESTVRDGLGALFKVRERVLGGPAVLDVRDVAAAAVEAVTDSLVQGPIGLSALKKYKDSL